MESNLSIMSDLFFTYNSQANSDILSEYTLVSSEVRYFFYILPFGK